jgi:pimeloyl-ACP methyl ester carboxylesterase
MAQLKLTQRCEQIRGLDTAWLEGGNENGPIMLFMHGYPDTPESWSSQFPDFLEHFHVIAPYSRGTFPSAPSKQVRRYGNPSTALDYLAILDRATHGNRSKPIIAVGHDLGAVHAWYLSNLLGKRLKGMVVINGLSVPQMAARLTQFQQQKKSWYIYAFQLPRVPELVLRRFPGRLIAYAHRQAKLRPDLRPRIAHTVKGLVNPVNQYRAHMRMLPWELGERAPIVQAPVMVLWGESDPFLLNPRHDEIAAYARNFTIRMLPGSHWVHREKPDLVNQLIGEFAQKSLETHA